MFCVFVLVENLVDISIYMYFDTLYTFVQNVSFLLHEFNYWVLVNKVPLC